MEDATRRRHFFHHGSPVSPSPPSSPTPLHSPSSLPYPNPSSFTHANALQGNEAEKRDCHWCQLRSFPNHATYPITVVNDLTSDTLPRDFRFIHEAVLRAGVDPAEASFRSGCECARDADCRYKRCACQADVEVEGLGEESSGDDEVVGAGRVQVYAYQTAGARAGMLSARMLQEDCDAVIYECHSGCACSAECPNRVVERGRRIPLQIFRTTNRGWGESLPFLSYLHPLSSPPLFTPPLHSFLLHSLLYHKLTLTLTLTPQASAQQST